MTGTGDTAGRPQATACARGRRGRAGLASALSWLFGWLPAPNPQPSTFSLSQVVHLHSHQRSAGPSQVLCRLLGICEVRYMTRTRNAIKRS